MKLKQSWNISVLSDRKLSCLLFFCKNSKMPPSAFSNNYFNVSMKMFIFDRWLFFVFVFPLHFWSTVIKNLVQLYHFLIYPWPHQWHWPKAFWIDLYNSHFTVKKLLPKKQSPLNYCKSRLMMCQSPSVKWIDSCRIVWLSSAKWNRP